MLFENIFKSLIVQGNNVGKELKFVVLFLLLKIFLFGFKMNRNSNLKSTPFFFINNLNHLYIYFFFKEYFDNY